MKSFKQFLSEVFSDAEMKVANATSRAKGAVGAKALVPRYVRQLASPDHKILDFGAGRHAAHASSLRDDGYHVTAHEFGSNQDEKLHDPKALSRKYDTVYASNVLNTQSSREMMGHTLDQIRHATKKGGQFIGNFPMSPRKAEDIDHEYLHDELAKRFKNVRRIGGTKKAPVFHAYDDKEDK